MFGDDKDPAPRENAAKPDKKPEGHTAPKKDRPRSDGDFDFHDWAAI